MSLDLKSETEMGASFFILTLSTRVGQSQDLFSHT